MLILELVLALVLLSSFSMVSALSSREIYGVKGAGWQSPDWNWGYAQGTGHDCAAICRRQFSTRKRRMDLIRDLLDSPNVWIGDRKPADFEEIKLVLALAWQRGRWDGTDGGPNGYALILQGMAAGQRYEIGSEQECSTRLVNDMQDKFFSLQPNPEDSRAMEDIYDLLEQDFDAARRRCSGLVLRAMNFVENGL